MKRVVITGMAQVTNAWQAGILPRILAGTSGERRSRALTLHFARHVAGEIQDFANCLVRRAGTQTCVALRALAVAASAKRSRAGLDRRLCRRRSQIGVILGTGGDAQEFTESSIAFGTPDT